VIGMNAQYERRVIAAARRGGEHAALSVTG